MDNDTFQCDYCKQTDLRQLVYNSTNDCHICTVCGTVLDHLCLAQFIHYTCQIRSFGQLLFTAQPAQDSVNLEGNPAGFEAGNEICPPTQSSECSQKLHGNKGTYKRMVHITEHISAHNHHAPKIPAHHLDTIKHYHLLLKGRNWIYRKLFESRIPTKKEIQTLLRFVDRHQEEYSRNYCHLYLEKWESLIEELENIERPVFSALEAAQIAVLMMKFSNLWDEWQPADGQRRKRKFQERKHFPNINYAFRQALHLLNLHKYDNAFPVPVTSLDTLNRYWEKMCHQLNIPFCHLTPTNYVSTMSSSGGNLTANSTDTTPDDGVECLTPAATGIILTTLDQHFQVKNIVSSTNPPFNREGKDLEIIVRKRHQSKLHQYFPSAKSTCTREKSPPPPQPQVITVSPNWQ